MSASSFLPRNLSGKAEVFEFSFSDDMVDEFYLSFLYNSRSIILRSCWSCPIRLSTEMLVLCAVYWMQWNHIPAASMFLVVAAERVHASLLNKRIDHTKHLRSVIFRKIEEVRKQ